MSPFDGTTAPLSGCVLITNKGSEIQIIILLAVQVAAVKIAPVPKELTDNKSRAWWKKQRPHRLYVSVRSVIYVEVTAKTSSLSLCLSLSRSLCVWLSGNDKLRITEEVHVVMMEAESGRSLWCNIDPERSRTEIVIWKVSLWVKRRQQQAKRHLFHNFNSSLAQSSVIRNGRSTIPGNYREVVVVITSSVQGVIHSGVTSGQSCSCWDRLSRVSATECFYISTAWE